MTARIKALIVALKQDWREDDAKALIAAIRQLRGVLDVKPVETTSEDWMNRVRITAEIEDRLWRALQDME